MSLNDDQFFRLIREDAVSPARTDKVGDRINTSLTAVELRRRDDGKWRGRPVGYASYHGGAWHTPSDYDWTFAKADVGETPPMFTHSPGSIDRMAVLPEFQGRGLGSQMTNHLAEEHWRRHPDLRGQVPEHTSLSPASAGMARKLVGKHTDSYWTDEGFDADDWVDQSDFHDEDGELDEDAYDDAVERALDTHRQEEMDNFAATTVDHGYSVAQRAAAHMTKNGSLAPGTDLGNGTRVALPPEHTVEENSNLVRYGMEPGSGTEAGPDEPRPARNRQMRLPGTYTRSLP